MIGTKEKNKLYLELWDSTTNTILARVMDAKADEGFAEQANRVTNTAAADRILSEWARELRERLDEVRHGEAKVLVRLPFFGASVDNFRVGPNRDVEHVLEVGAIVMLHSASRQTSGSSP